jgi:OmpA-OmpF porin, OOP family
MSNNLLELLKEYLSGDVILNLSTLIGESSKNTESAIHTALPSLLAALTEQNADTKKIASLFNLLKEGNHDGGVLSNLGALSRGGDESDKLVSEGGKLVVSLLGDKASSIADLVTSASGISKASTNALLGFITPIILGLVGKRLRIERNENPDGLAALLLSQNGFLEHAIPAPASDNNVKAAASDATNTLSDFDKAANSLDSDDLPSYIAKKTAPITETLGSVGETIEDIAENTLLAAKNMAAEFGDTAAELGSQIVEESKEIAQNAAEAFEEGAGEDRKFLPWILIAAALALVWGLLKSCSIPETPPETVAPTVSVPAVTPLPTPAPPSPEPTATAPLSAPAPSAPPEPAKVEAPATSNFFEKTLPSGYVIKSVKDGFESKLIAFIESTEAINKDLWFTMDGITFDTNEATIKSESTSQIDDITEVLKAYPKVKIKIGGYTDNTGKANANKTLSDNRANAVKEALISKGTEADRIDAEGYGSEHPVATNETPEGRQQNRRIAVTVTEK